MFDDRVLKHGPWSISKANVLDICAKQFANKYVRKQKEQRKSSSSRVGVVVHALLEKELESPGQKLTELLEKHAEQDQLTSDERREALTRIPAVEEFGVRIRKFKEQNGVKQELIEYKLAMNSDFTAATFFSNSSLLRGVLDHGMITDKNVMIVIDHKTGRKKPITEHSTQLYAYMLLVMANFGVTQVQCGINYIGSPTVDWFPRLDGSSGAWSREEVAKLRLWLEHYLNKSARKLVLIDAQEERAETGWQCEYCGYVDGCPDGLEALNKRRAKKGGGALNL